MFLGQGQLELFLPATLKKTIRDNVDAGIASFLGSEIIAACQVFQTHSAR